MRIGIIGPSEDEIKYFIKDMKIIEKRNFTKLNFHVGKYKNLNFVALFCGVGKVNAAIASQLLIDKFNITHIIIVGVAGGITKELNIGDTVIGTEIACHDVSDEILTEYHPFMKSIYFILTTHY